MTKPKSPKVRQTNPTHPCPAENFPGSLTPKQKCGDGKNAIVISSHNTLSSSGCKSRYGAGTNTVSGLDISSAEAAEHRQPKSRLVLEYYYLLPDILPNGLPRTPPIRGTAGLVLGGDFRIEAEVRRDKNGELFVGVSEIAWDTEQKHCVIMDFSPRLLRTIHEITLRAHSEAVALVSAQGARN